MTEAEFLAALRTLPLHPGAAGLRDDAATLTPGGDTLVLSTDTMVEGVHFPADMAPADVAWRLVACALSDLAAKGAEPVGVLLNYPLRNPPPMPSPAKAGAQSWAADGEGPRETISTSATGPRPSPGKDEGEGSGCLGWDHAFLDGLGHVLAHYTAPIIGGDTVSIPPHAPRVLTITAIGRVTHLPVPVRSGAKPGDLLWITGTIGAALLGFERPDTAPNAYRRPTVRIADGTQLAPHVTAMMDVSDGLLLDAQRMAAASKLAVAIALDVVPVPREFATDRLRAVTWGDDYQLLFALPAGVAPAVAATCIGAFAPGSGLTLTEHGTPVHLPPRLGYQHG
ncbi:thiamine-phosphate kinase [Sphingomonas sp.]|uniref:thiamine-phosphate kinase n=1 Tax=Sphingomonas sp. TaxID=28214 RepID=UPI003341FA0D